MKKINITVGTNVMLFGSDDIITIDGIYKRSNNNKLCIEGKCEMTGEEVEDIPFNHIYAVVTPLSVKDKNIEWARLISEVCYKEN